MTYLPPADGFLGLEGEDATAPEDAKVVIVPFGIEQSVSYGGGTVRGPEAMITASHQVELFDEELWREPCRDFHLNTLAPFDIPQDIPAALDRLAGVVGGILDEGRFPLTFGGEHSITPGAIRPFVERYPDLCLLQFDAHADLRDGYEGEHFSHAAAMRRCLDNENLTLVSVGIRNISAGEIPFLEANRHRIHIYWGKDRRDWDVQQIVSHLKGRPLYITFDLDGVDASLMQATGTPEPGGVFWDDAVRIIRAATEVAGEVVGADINELAPIEGLHSCNFLAAKPAY